jgi:hypothetical protein
MRYFEKGAIRAQQDLVIEKVDDEVVVRIENDG